MFSCKQDILLNVNQNISVGAITGESIFIIVMFFYLFIETRFCN